MTAAEELIQENLNRLIRGLLQNSQVDVYKSHKTLYDIGSPVLLPLRQKLLEIDWSNSRLPKITSYMSGLFSLLHDIDEEEANSVGNEIKSNGCPSHIKITIDSICSDSIKNYKYYKIHGISVFEQKSINSKCSIKEQLETWLNNVPKEDLKGIDRLYVVTKDSIKAAGTYTPIFKIISLCWNNTKPQRSIPFKIISLITENVLYHEIGHHVKNHKFGTDPDQEMEADKYALNIMKKVHPKLCTLISLLSKVGFKSKTNYYRWGL